MLQQTWLEMLELGRHLSIEKPLWGGIQSGEVQGQLVHTAVVAFNGFNEHVPLMWGALCR